MGRPRSPAADIDGTAPVLLEGIFVALGSRASATLASGVRQAVVVTESTRVVLVAAANEERGGVTACPTIGEHAYAWLYVGIKGLENGNQTDQNR